MSLQSIPAFYFDRAKLAAIASDKSASFREAKPFQHCVFEDFLPRDVFDLLVREFVPFVELSTDALRVARAAAPLARALAPFVAPGS